MAAPNLVIDELRNHLSNVRKNPSLPLNKTLLKTINGYLSELIPPDDRESILSSCSDLIPVLRQDPAPVLGLVNFLIRPESFTFSKVLVLKPAVDFEAGLSSLIPPLNLSTLNLLRKATHNESDADIVAGWPRVVAALIRLWLCTPDNGVCERARTVLLGLLKASKQDSSHSASFHQSLMWRRVFRDRDMYGLIFSICSLKTIGEPDQPGTRAKTLAQGRLLDLLVQLIDYKPIQSSQLPEIETKYGVKDGGLLKFAAVYMVEYDDDPLMHNILIMFFTNLLRSRSSTALDFLIKNGLHDSTTSYYTNREDINSIRLSVMYPRAAEYIAVYCSNFEVHLLSNRSFVEQLIRCLNNVIQVALLMGRPVNIPPHDLKILASLPRAVLLPLNSSVTPLFGVIPEPRDANNYKALARIFRGTVEPTLQDCSRSNENSAARALYFVYKQKFPTLWKSVCRDANVIALKEVALAAIGVIGAVISANWEPLPTESLPSSPGWPTLPTEQELASECGVDDKQLPSSGLNTLLDSQDVVTYLCNPPPAFRSAFGGIGHSESDAYQVAVAKYDVMLQFRQKLKDAVQGRPQLQGILALLEEKLAQGPSGGSSGVGGRIGTLDL
ncbi:hypothetical protein MMC22_005783 [Lobaria immixta]|nr:hypothetical protein [Lobaria immixta]